MRDREVTRRPYDVFISYRRENGAAEARLIQSALAHHGLRVFLDVTDLKKGYFDESLLKQIALAPSFLIVLPPGALDRCVQAGDWLRTEIAQALGTKRNIVPVMLPGFKFPAELPDELASLPRYQGVEYSHVLFEATVNKLVEMVRPSEPWLQSQARRLRTPSARHTPWLLGSFAVAIAAVALLILHPWSSNQTQILKIANDLRADYRVADQTLESTGSANFAPVNRDIGDILRLDPKNGTGLYYSGEVERVQNRMLFTPKSCIKSSGLKNELSRIEDYHDFFYRYIEVEQSLPEREKSGNGEVCYGRPSGYCAERTAWIDHLLANDFYGEASLATNPSDEAVDLERANDYEKSAAKLYSNEQGVSGFSQCIGTQTLLEDIQSRLTALRREPRQGLK